MPFPPYLQAILDLLNVVIKGSEAVGAFQAEYVDKDISTDASPNAERLKREAIMAYVKLYYIAAPMIGQQTKWKEGYMEGLPDPSKEMPALGAIPAHFRKLTDLIFKHKIITVKFFSQMQEEAEKMEEGEDDE